jgi:tetrapyrrole methylase family protein / MazG family protein
MPYLREQFADLVTLIRRLRAENGCPWDQKQTPHSLLPHLRAECDELVAAIGNNDPANTCEELGDLLYLLVMYAEIHAERGEFGLAEVIDGVAAKLTRRHPHVFAGKPYENEEQLARQWQEIKEMEKKKNII